MKPGLTLLLCFLSLCGLQSFAFRPRRRRENRDARREDGGLELLHVNFLWRHGARSPLRRFPGDPNLDYKWNQEGRGQLTKIGMRQQFDLGSFLRRRYRDFLSSAYKREEIYVRSTDSERTLMSAQCNMAGMYEPKGDQVWNEELNWQPIPVHTIETSDDTLLHLPNAKTPSFRKLYFEVAKGAKHQFLNKKYQPFLGKLKDFVQSEKNVTILDTYYIYDFITTAKTEGLEPPGWYKGKLKTTLFSLATYAYGMIFGHKTPQQNNMLKLTQGYLVKQILENFDNSINQTVPYKAFAYSGHDTTMIGLLTAFDNYRALPTFSSCLMFELYRDPSAVGENQYIVKTFYRTSKAKPEQLNLLGCGLNCPLAKLKRLSVSVIPDDE